MKERKFSYKITPQQAQYIINSAPAAIKPQLVMRWATSIVLRELVPVGKTYYYEVLRKNADEQMHEVLDEVYGKEKEKEFTSDDLKVGEYMQVTEVGEYMEVTKGFDQGQMFICRIHGGTLVDINNPNHTWENKPSFIGRKVSIKVSEA